MFTKGFKTAAFDHNNQGLEFKMGDMGNPMVGPGGMGPSGDETYQPAGKLIKKEDKKVTARKAIQAMYKLGGYESGGINDGGLSDSSGSDIASSTVNQLKWTSQNGPNLEQEADDRKEQKARRKSYLKAKERK